MPKYSGPRLPSGRYYSKRRAGRKPAAKSKPKRGGLNKTEVKQTKQIAKRVLNQNSESKYFDVRTISQLSGAGQAGIIPTPARLLYPQLYVVGFAAGEADVNNSVLTYGQNTIEAIHHGRIHPDGQAQNQDIEGQYVRPSLSITTFDIQRIITGSDLSLETARNMCPFMVRVLRLCPKPRKGSSQNLDPERDAFLDQNNQETGVADSTFEHYELLLLKANTKKYTVKGDMRFMLNPPLTTTEVGTGNASFPTSHDVGNISTNIHRQMTFKHDIGKRLFYENPNVRSNPTDGFKNEYILFHIIPVGTGNLGDIIPSTVRFCAKAVSTFKDV